MLGPDLLGHIGYLLVVVGTLMIARKDIRGWWPRMVGDVFIVSMGLLLGVSSLWIWGTVFLLIDIFGYRKWKREAM